MFLPFFNSHGLTALYRCIDLGPSVISLRPNCTVWYQRLWSSLTYTLEALSHYLNQCSLFVTWTPRNTFQWNVVWNSNSFRKKMHLKMLAMAAILIWPQCVNSLWPSDTIWWHRTESTLVQVMAWCLMASSHYLKHCWIFISISQWYSSDVSSLRDTPGINPIKLAWTSFIWHFIQIYQGQSVKSLTLNYTCTTL